ncbi:flagellar basal body rod protein FlgB [uncultured Zhongshania sp.]|jgi:flagellar basal-body rod protein FlgB|uniref:flagellar basal body rod protein FlgB n=1 Tax=uncultured Zhongshania sp. TaxID=1642288 RepID=UPI0030DCB552|tara:strand:+ start:642 stop:1058 length:417 start_codon:yes stop_codon:yes gene_type:complete
MSINFDKALGIHEQALQVRDKRNEVLATNIANADTPGYKAQDIDFKAVLSQSAASGNSMQLAMRTTNSGHIQGMGAATDGLPMDLQYRVPTQPSQDGNTVDTHLEQAEFADNAMRYQATLSFLSSRFSGMKSVLQGGR